MLLTKATCPRASQFIPQPLFLHLQINKMNCEDLFPLAFPTKVLLFISTVVFSKEIFFEIVLQVETSFFFPLSLIISYFRLQAVFSILVSSLLFFLLPVTLSSLSLDTFSWAFLLFTAMSISEKTGFQEL